MFVLKPKIQISLRVATFPPKRAVQMCQNMETAVTHRMTLHFFPLKKHAKDKWHKKEDSCGGPNTKTYSYAFPLTDHLFLRVDPGSAHYGPNSHEQVLNHLKGT